MSGISDGYDAVLARIQVVLSTEANGYFRLPNPYKPEENGEDRLKKGYGIALGAAVNSNRFVNCSFSVARQFQIILTRKYVALENDAVRKADAEKALFEDLNLLINDFEQDISVNGNTMYTRYEADGGIEYVQGDTDKFIMLRTTFVMEYVERFT